MSDFKIFQVNKGAKFLGKVKSLKDKKEEQTKKNINLLKLQKNIRAFLVSNRYAGHNYPLLIRNTEQIIRNREYVENLWVCSEEIPQLLKTRISTLTIETLMQDKFLNINIEKLLLTVSEQAQNNRNLKVRHYEFLIDKYFEIICFTNLLAKLMAIPYFKAAFQNLLTHKVTRLVFLVQQIKDVNLTNQIIESYYKNSKIKIEQQKDEQNLQQLRSCFNKSMQMAFASIQNKHNEDHLLYLMSIIMQKLKSKYIELILNKYKIERSLFFSGSFREEISEFLDEKEEWQEYQDCILPLTHLFPHFLSKFYKASLFSVEFILNMIIEISKFNQTFATLKLQNNQFFVLLQKLDSKGLLIKQQFDLKQYQLLFTVIILQKYLESLNDIQFVNQFRFDKQKMGKYIKTFVIKFMKDMCSLSGESDMTTEILRHSELLMSNLYNKMFRTNLLSTTIFEDNSLQTFLNTHKLHLNSKFYSQMMKIVQRSPFLLPINTRFMMFRNLVKKQDYHGFGYQKIEVRVRRKHEFEDTFDKLYKKSLKSRIKVVFINEYGMVESGIDAGGLTKELLTRVFKIAFDPKFTLFIQNDKKELMPNPQYQNIKQGQKVANMYEFVGQLLGKSLYENIMLGVKFAGPFLNLLINKKNTFDDLMSVDQDLYRSVVYIMGMQEGVDDLQLTFLYQDNINKKYINLVPQGHLVKVTDQNKMQYLNLLVNYKVNHSFEKQTRFIRKGLRCMIKQKWLEMFNYAELNYLISGTGTIDVKDWRQHTHYRGNIDQDYIQTFWDIVGKFSEQQKSLLLKFVTSCQRPSVLGFKDIHPPFCISFVSSNHQLPTSHTCSNMLDLPIYESPQVLKQKLLYAIKAQAGFQFG